MDLKEKRELIKKHKDIAVAALNAILDQTYNLTDTYFDENNNLKEELTKNEKLENLIKSLRQDTMKYEKVRRKLLDDDFNLSLYEINLVGLSLMYASIRVSKYIEMLTKTKTTLEIIFQAFIDSDSEKIDFSKGE